MSNTDKQTFEQQLSLILDKSVEQLDGDTLQKLEQAKQQALAAPDEKPTPRFVTPAAIAASVLMAVSVFWLYQPHTTVDAALYDDLAYIEVDPEMLESMDMLLALGEPPEAL